MLALGCTYYQCQIPLPPSLSPNARGSGECLFTMTSEGAKVRAAADPMHVHVMQGPLVVNHAHSHTHDPFPPPHAHLAIAYRLWLHARGLWT